MLSLLRQRNYGLLWFGQVISVAGDWVLNASLVFYVYAMTGSVLATGVMFMIATLPRLLLGSVAGVFVDRWDRWRTMIVSDLLRALLILVLLTVRSPSSIWIVYLVALVETAIAQFFGPAKSALVPRIVTSEELIKANSLNSLGEEIGRLSGPAIGGLMLARLGLPSVVFFDVCSFLFSGAMLALMALPPGAGRPETTPDLPQSSGLTTPGPATVIALMADVWRQWLDGLRVMRRNQVVASLLLVFAICMVGEGLLEVLFVPWVKEVMAGDSAMFGWMMSAQAVGSIAGGLILAAAGKRRATHRLLILGAAGWGLIDLAIFNVRWLPLSLALFVLVGLPIAAMFVATSTIIQHEVADAYRGRAFGALATTGALTTLGGMAIASAIGQRAGIVPMLNLACLAVLAGAVVGWVLLIARPTTHKGRRIDDLVR